MAITPHLSEHLKMLGFVRNFLLAIQNKSHKAKHRLASVIPKVHSEFSSVVQQAERYLFLCVTILYRDGVESPL